MKGLAEMIGEVLHTSPERSILFPLKIELWHFDEKFQSQNLNKKRYIHREIIHNEINCMHLGNRVNFPCLSFKRGQR